MAATHTMRTRDVRGPGVAGVAVIAKPPAARPPDHLILERRRHDEIRQNALDTVAYNAKFELKVSCLGGGDVMQRRRRELYGLEEDVVCRWGIVLAEWCSQARPMG